MMKENETQDALIVAKRQKNSRVVLGMNCINLLLAVTYFIEVVKGARSANSYMIILAGCIIPPILYMIAYFTKKEGTAVRYIMTIGFCALYGYIMFTTQKNLAFCYIIIMFILLTVYEDLKLSWSCSIYAVVINAVVIVKNEVTVGLTEAQITEAEVILICLLLSGIFSIMVTSVTSKINSVRMEQIDSEKIRISNLLDTILVVSESMVQNIFAVSAEMGQLEQSITLTKNSMEKLSNGAQDTANAIQTQHESTEEINVHIAKVEEVTYAIGYNVKSAEKILSQSQAVMGRLIEQVETSESASNQVAQEMSELRNYADKMQGIMTLINNVASQTGLLALNASIEAARAGEAGKGFAVVASEISNLAKQTGDATDDINKLIESIDRSLSKVVNSVDSLLESNQMQSSYVGETAQNFETIHKNTDNISDQSLQLEVVVQKVLTANTIIAESIQNVSDATQEVLIHAAETVEDSGKNKERVETVSGLVDLLSENAEKLKKNY